MSTLAATDLAPADYNGRCVILADQIVAATSCPADVARMAANSFHSYRNLPDHGFGDASGDLVTRLKWMSARVALADWKASQAAPVAFVQRRAA